MICTHVQTAKAVASLRFCEGWSQLLLFANQIHKSGDHTWAKCILQECKNTNWFEYWYLHLLEASFSGAEAQLTNKEDNDIPERLKGYATEHWNPKYRLFLNQLLQLWTAHTISSDPIVRSDSVRSGNFTTVMVNNEIQRNSGNFPTLISDKSLIDYRTLTKIGLPANIDGP